MSKEKNEIKYPQKRISIRDDVYRELKERARREKYSAHDLAEKILEDYIKACHSHNVHEK